MMAASWRKAPGSIVPGFSVLMATSVLPFHNPYQTSPKFPLPSLRMSCTELRGISHSSRVSGDRSQTTGLGLGQAMVSLWHKPFAPSM
uniref:Putative secreted protein n=1 Tax=Ixodes ricinus TaxID=34613 RepID=A0A6B0UBU3_IXORI